MARQLLFSLSLTFFVAACSGDTAGSGNGGGSGGCSDNDDCDSGQICLSSGDCANLCTNDGDCGASEICEETLCEEGKRPNAPTISTLDGDSTNLCFTSSDGHCIAAGIVVGGTHLDGAAFTLTPEAGSPVHELTVRDGRTDTLVALDLPDVAPGLYSLGVANGAGSVDQSVELLKGDPGEDGAAFAPTNNEVVDMVNGATNTILHSRLPIGTTSSHVAAGEHDHGTAVALAQGTCGDSETGALAYDAANDLAVCDGSNWISVRPPRRGGTTQADAAYSCKAIVDADLAGADGTYWIDPTGGATSDAFEVHCDMTSDGGGWTLVAYAGTITGNKAATTGSINFQPLFYDYGTYDATAPSSGNAFSHLDLFPHIFHNDSEFLAKRTSVPDNHFIWPVSDAGQWRNTMVLPDAGYVKLSNDGGATYYKRMYSLSVFSQVPMPTYTGYDWNPPAASNCDNCGASFATGLNHRSLLYWELDDDTGGYTWNQWFHGSPLTLTDSTGPENTVQDIEFYVRESRRRF